LEVTRLEHGSRSFLQAIFFLRELSAEHLHGWGLNELLSLRLVGESDILDVVDPELI
jgi:hypothetical protein